MLEKQTEALVSIIKDQDLQEYAGEGIWNLIQAVVAKDPLAGAEAVKKVKDLVFHFPTVLFWGKMQRFLLGTFHDFKDQVRMSQKFSEDNEDYQAFVKRQIHLINEFDDDTKVDYFASLTRCFLTTDLDRALYFKLSKFLSICTPEELIFLKECPIDYSSYNTAIISSLFQYGLFTQKEKDDGSGDICYVLSDFAIALKQNSLNYDNGLHGANRLTSYERLTPLNLTEPTTVGQFSLEPIESEKIKEAVDRAYSDTEFILNGGTASS